MTIDEKFENLKMSLKQMERVVVAYSGGVDSTFLLKAASISGLDQLLAVTGISESLPSEEASFAEKMSRDMDVPHRTIVTEELKNADYASNPPDRCYFCKKELFGKLNLLADEEGFRYVLDGTNADDASDWRPGSKAAREERVLSPLCDIGMTKTEIRELSRQLGLPTWDKPATPCLSSRFPYGQKISAEALERVHKAELFMKKYGLKEFRVRNHGEVARLEIPPEQFSIIMEEGARDEVSAYLRSLGFRYVTLDIQGFRSGSANESLQEK